MSSCSSRCQGGCCSDRGSKARRAPSLLQLDVMQGILAKSFRNMIDRTVRYEAGRLTSEDLEAADKKLHYWLVETLSGGNTYYRASDEWHPHGLVDYLVSLFPDDLATVSHSPRVVLEEMVARYIADAYETMKSIAKAGVSPALALEHPLANALTLRWAQLFCGGYWHE